MHLFTTLALLVVSSLCLSGEVVRWQDEQGKTLSTFIEKAKGISSDAGLAKDKALEKLAQQLSQSLGANLVKAID